MLRHPRKKATSRGETRPAPSKTPQVAPPTLAALRKELYALADPADAIFLQRFFKAAPGEYGAGDKFLGLRVPALRRLVREYRQLADAHALEILASSWHEDQFGPTLKIARILVRDSHDLIHKAVGWMLREVGKRDRDTEDGFLKKHHQVMPHTMLRYAIERYPEQLRKQYLAGTV